MSKFKINDLPQTTELAEFDSFEVSKFNTGQRSSAHVNFTDVANAVEASLITTAKGLRFLPSRFGVGAWINTAGSYNLNLPNISTTSRWQEIIINLADWGTIPDTATHVLLDGFSSFVFTNSNGYIFHVYGIDYTDSSSAQVTLFETQLAAIAADPSLSLAGTQTAIANNVSKTIVRNSGVSAGQDTLNLKGDTIVPIDRTDDIPRIKVLVALSEGNGSGGYQVPNLALINTWTLTMNIEGFYL
jgi:hypothetical protein